MVDLQTLESADYFHMLKSSLSTQSDDSTLFEAIVNTPFENKLITTQLGLGIIVFLLVNTADKTIDRLALSKTFPAEGAVSASVKEFKAIRIPVGYNDNLIARVIENKQWEKTTDWKDLFVPELTPQEARFNQAGAGIAYSVVHPLHARDGGALIFSYFEAPEKNSNIHHAFMSRYSSLVSHSLR
jgi:hypothetical protein